MRKITVALILGLVILSISTNSFSQTRISPMDPNISVMGRVLTVENDNLQFDWPAVTISANFSGSSCSIIMDDTKLFRTNENGRPRNPCNHFCYRIRKSQN